MEKVINLYKPVGETPLQAVEVFKVQYPEYESLKISYAGRLDPMACGVLVLLVGDENKKMKTYMGLDKEYKAKILLGFNSDTYDILGLASFNDCSELDVNEIKKILKGFKGSYNQTLPAYSSYRIKGKPLFYYARNGRLDEVEIPSSDVEINGVNVERIYKIDSGDLLKEIVRKVGLVDGDFRQSEIIKNWEGLLVNRKEKYFVVDVAISCSSGTYIRAIAEDFGGKLGCGGLLLDLLRTKVGRFSLVDSRRLR